MGYYRLSVITVWVISGLTVILYAKQNDKHLKYMMLHKNVLFGSTYGKSQGQCLEAKFLPINIPMDSVAVWQQWMSK